MYRIAMDILAVVSWSMLVLSIVLLYFVVIEAIKDLF